MKGGPDIFERFLRGKYYNVLVGSQLALASWLAYSGFNQSNIAASAMVWGLAAGCFALWGNVVYKKMKWKREFQTKNA